MQDLQCYTDTINKKGKVANTIYSYTYTRTICAVAHHLIALYNSRAHCVLSAPIRVKCERNSALASEQTEACDERCYPTNGMWNWNIDAIVEAGSQCLWIRARLSIYETSVYKLFTKCIYLFNESYKRKLIKEAKIAQTIASEDCASALHVLRVSAHLHNHGAHAERRALRLLGKEGRARTAAQDPHRHDRTG